MSASPQSRPAVPDLARLWALVRSWEHGNEQFGASDRERNRAAMLASVLEDIELGTEPGATPESPRRPESTGA